jgi:modulator of FtsH protease
MGLVSATTLTFALGAYLGRSVAYEWGWFFFVVSLVVLIGINVTASTSTQAAIALLFAFGVFIGLSTAPTLAYYASEQPETLWRAGVATALLVAGLGSAGYATRRDLSALARFLFWALLVLIVFGIVAIFVQIPNASVIYAIAGLVIFAGLTAYDFQRLRKARDIRTAPLLAASIFLDAINLFLLFVGLFDRTKD